MDLTSGFFQAPIHPESARYTAFTVWFGNFQFKRVAMGLKGAPAFFQQKLATEVLGGLIHSICELYLDDLNTYADTLEEYLRRIALVLTRFREHGIIVNPKKCKLLMKKVQYVGYVISNLGIEFSDELKEKALQFELPKSYKLLKQFVGVVERFHRHVESFTEIARPLHTMLQGYSQRKNRHQVIQWDKAQEEAFYALQKAVNNAKKLFFCP